MKTLFRNKAFWSIVIVAALSVGGFFTYRAVFLPRHFVIVRDGVLYRCAQPMGLKWDVLQRYGIRSVINLRPPQEDAAAYEEEVQACRKAGVKFASIPLSNDTVLPESNDIRMFLRVVQESPPALVHCQFGRKRTGVIVGAYRVIVDDWSVDEAMVEMEKYQANLRDLTPKVRALLAELKANRQKWLVEASASAPATK